MPYCPSTLTFSAAHADKRLGAAYRTLGEAVVKRLLAYALFLMGAKREDIAAHLALPLGTLLSLLTRIGHRGVAAIEDRRRRPPAIWSPAPATVPPPQVTLSGSSLQVTLGTPGVTVSMPRHHTLQTKVVLLTLLDSGVLDRAQVAQLLGYSLAHVARLAQRLAAGDATALVDQRQGQQHDYRITAAVKAELVQQFAVDVITRGHTSGAAIAAELQTRCQIRVSPRTVRHHLARLGLPRIKATLPPLLAALKKNSAPSADT